MLTCNDYRRAYEKLYKAMRNYIWGVDVVELLANFEVAVYDAFIDVEKAESYFNKLKKAIHALRVEEDDEDLAAALDNISKLFEDTEDQYLPIYRVNETLTEEDIEDNDHQEEYTGV